MQKPEIELVVLGLCGLIELLKVRTLCCYAETNDQKTVLSLWKSYRNH